MNLFGWFFDRSKKTDDKNDKEQIVEFSDVVRLPDDSAFCTARFPLPADHWIYEEKAHDPPPMPFRMGISAERNKQAVAIKKAARYAIRASTMNGKETDFDPDAMVQNMVVGMLGYYTADGLTDDDWGNPKLKDMIPECLNSRETLLSFISWITGRKEVIIASRAHGVAPWLELLNEFCAVNSFADTRPEWHKLIKMPEE